jgi:hypothetical protein
VDEAVEETFPASDPIAQADHEVAAVVAAQRVGKVGLDGRHVFPFGR